MQSIANENKLLKGYIQTLERENQARNIERTTLFNEIDRMTLEIDRLNTLLSKHTKSGPPTPANNKQLTRLKEENSQLKSKLKALIDENHQFTNELKIRQNLIDHLREQKMGLELEMNQQIEGISISANIKTLALEEDLKNCQQKLSTLALTQQNNIILRTKIDELLNENNTLKEQLSRTYSELEKQRYLSSEMKTKDDQIIQAQKNSAELANLLNAKTNLEATVKRLNSKIQWLQSNTKGYEQTRFHWEAKINQLEMRLQTANEKITEYQSKEKDVTNLQASRTAKLQEIEGLQQMIKKLKQNKRHLEKNLRDKQEIITSLQLKISQLTKNQSQYQNLKNEINRSAKLNVELQQQNKGLKRINQQLLSQINKIQQKEQAYQSQMTTLRKERESLLQEIDEYILSLDEARTKLKQYEHKIAEYKPNLAERSFETNPQAKRASREGEEDIRSVVFGLKQDVDNLKAMQIRPQTIMDHSQVESYLSINSKSQLMMQNRSPPRIAVNSEKQSMKYNGNKWQNLQRKIFLLRSQNQNLKKTLFS